MGAGLALLPGAGLALLPGAGLPETVGAGVPCGYARCAEFTGGTALPPLPPQPASTRRKTVSQRFAITECPPRATPPRPGKACIGAERNKEHSIFHDFTIRLLLVDALTFLVLPYKKKPAPIWGGQISVGGTYLTAVQWRTA
jgi:hypothetical protein